jgi:hypothetical protein
MHQAWSKALLLSVLSRSPPCLRDDHSGSRPAPAKQRTGLRGSRLYFCTP